MSAVRMCDRCGTIFSENSDGWSTGSITRKVKSGRTTQYQEVAQDFCARCSGVFDETIPALNGTDDRLDRLADTIE